MAMIGWSAEFAINDGSGSSWLDVDNVQSLGFPPVSVSEIESTHLGSANARKEFIPGLSDGGAYQVVAHYTSSLYSRLATLVGSTASFRITSPTDDNSETFTHNGFIKTLIVAIVAGKIVEIFGKVVDVFARCAAMAKELPEAIRPDWVGKFVDGVAEFGAVTRKAGADLSAWGEKQVGAWGKSAEGIDAWFDKLGKRRRDFAKGTSAEMMELKYTATPAMLKGSDAAIGVEQRFKFEGIAKEQEDKNFKKLEQQLEQLKIISGLLESSTGLRLI